MESKEMIPNELHIFRNLLMMDIDYLGNKGVIFMAVTEYMSIPYDEKSLTEEECNELEDFSFLLYRQLEGKVHEMGLTIIEGFSQYIGRVTDEQRDNINRNHLKQLEKYFWDEESKEWKLK